MNSDNDNLHDTPAAQRCADCEAYEYDVQVYEILVLALAFIGPIIGILIGLFAGKKLIGK